MRLFHTGLEVNLFFVFVFGFSHAAASLSVLPTFSLNLQLPMATFFGQKSRSTNVTSITGVFETFPVFLRPSWKYQIVPQQFLLSASSRCCRKPLPHPKVVTGSQSLESPEAHCTTFLGRCSQKRGRGDPQRGSHHHSSSHACWTRPSLQSGI